MNVLLRMLYVPGVLATTPESPVRLPVRYRSGTTAARTTRYTLAVAAMSFAREAGPAHRGPVRALERKGRACLPIRYWRASRRCRTN